MTRKGSTIFYISMAIISVLGAIFLILTGVFYSQSKRELLDVLFYHFSSPYFLLVIVDFPDSSTNTAKVAGMGICGFAFYVGLQLILIGIWHQKYREENPKSLARKIDPHNDSTAQLKSSMENNAQYDYSYGQQMDYTPYGAYAPAPYAANVSEQMLLQQPGAATGAAYYDPVLWPSNIEFETPPDPRFFRPMEASYGQGTNYEQTANVTPGYIPLATVVEAKRRTDARSSSNSHSIHCSSSRSSEEENQPYWDHENSCTWTTKGHIRRHLSEFNRWRHDLA